MLLRDEKTISAYEVHIGRLVPVLLHCVKGGVTTDPQKVQARVGLFKTVFANTLQEAPVDLDIRCVLVITLSTYSNQSWDGALIGYSSPH